MPKAQNITYKGETHNMSEWAKIAGLKYTTFKMRYDKWDGDMDRFMNAPLRKPPGYMLNGKHVTAAEIARLNGTITKHTVESRKRNGWTVEEIIRTPEKCLRGTHTPREKALKPKKQPAERPKPPEPKKGLFKWDGEQCKTCKYRAGRMVSHTCDYATITGHCRITISSSLPPNCELYVKGDPDPVKKKTEKEAWML